MIIAKIGQTVGRVEDLFVFSFVRIPWIAGRLIPIQQALYHDCFGTSLIILCSFLIISFLPLLLSGSFPYHSAISVSGDALKSPHYLKWLLVSVFCGVPMLIELLFDWGKLFQSRNQKREWLSSFILSLGITLPNLIVYCWLSYLNDYNISDFSTQLYLTIIANQQIVLFSAMLFHLFDHKAINRNLGFHQSYAVFNIEHRTVNILILITIAIFAFVTGTAVQSTEVLACSILFTVFSLILVGFLALRITFMELRQLIKGHRLKAHRNSPDVMFRIAILLFVAAWTGISVYFSSLDDNSTIGPEVLNKFLYLQIVFTCFIAVNFGLRTKTLAAVEQVKLESRLNLIRYASHEIRTPLSTAFMGLTLINSELSSWKFKLSDYPLSDLRKGELAKKMMPDGTIFREIHKTLSKSRSEDKNTESFYDVTNKRSDNDSILAMQSDASDFITVKDIDAFVITIGQVSDSCKVALQTLDDLLLYDKLDEQKLTIEMQEINPWDLLATAAKPFAINAKDARVNYTVSVQEVDKTEWTDKFHIKGDSFKLTQVIRNLISNALKFTPQNGMVEVMLLMTPSSPGIDDHNDFVRIAVKDSGPGISRENQKKLFGQYVQINTGKLQHGSGTGLGLWISKGNCRIIMNSSRKYLISVD